MALTSSTVLRKLLLHIQVLMEHLKRGDTWKYTPIFSIQKDFKKDL